ncbi:hypothetical protein [Kitasatospora sp. NPDC093806]|uniref:hypothetical protein n=1 Tax=Kitasatospora sp. NPDC093806 TaxID=3155075 RepID=UPI003430A4F9
MGQLPEQVGPGPWLAAACLLGLMLAYFVLNGFTDELRAAWWGVPGQLSEVACSSYDNGTGATEHHCSGTFTPDGGGWPREVTVDGDTRSTPGRAWLADDTGGTAYIDPSAWWGVPPVAISLLLVGVPGTATVWYARRARAARLGPSRQDSRWAPRRDSRQAPQRDASGLDSTDF